MQMTVMERARRLVAGCPVAVDGMGGCHAATFRVAAALVWGFGLSPEEAYPIMQEWNSGCQPPWKEYEIWHKLRSALGSTHTQARGHLVGDGAVKGDALPYEAPKARAKVEFNLDALKKVAMRVPEEITDEWLRKRSPVDPAAVDLGQVLDLLYEADDRVMVFGSMRSLGDWMRWRRRWYRLGKSPQEKAIPVEKLPERTKEGMVFGIQPVDGQWHLKVGTPTYSRRTRQSVVRYPYLLLESDEAPRELWLRAMVQVKLPVVCIVTSAGRSLHALVKIGCNTHEEWLDLANIVRDTMARIGCDAQALKNASVNCRAPGVLRDGKMKDGKFLPFPHGPSRQRLLWLNPQAMGGQSMMEVLPRA